MIETKRTKIIATLGPSSNDLATLAQLIEAGVNVVRLNFSHGKAEDHIQRAKLAREAARSLNTEIAVLADLQGPKIRIARFENGKVALKNGQKFILDAQLDNESGNESHVGIDYKELPQDVKENDILLLDDGRLQFKVEKVEQHKIYCTVEVGGELSNNKGINRLGGGLSAQALTDKDKEDLKTAVALAADYIAISFPRSAQDIEYARELLNKLNSDAGIIAKIERAEAIEVIDEIIKVSDGVMVARGDLGVEIGDANLPGAQKHIIHRARVLNKPVITATQMLETMIHNNIPTRAEVFDIANAVLDYTDAVMLSAETATGEHPIEAVGAMARICAGAEKERVTRVSGHRIECHFESIDEAIAMSAMYAANHMDIKAIIAITESGYTPLLMSRIRSAIPIYGFSQHIKTRRKMCLYRSVFPVEFNVKEIDPLMIFYDAIQRLLKSKLVQEGDHVIVTGGDVAGVRGGTNLMKVLRIGTGDVSGPPL